MRWADYIAHMGNKRNVYRILIGKSEGIEATRKFQT
jgi:hypothetical protein